MDVVKFFSDHVFQDLQAESGSVHPILQVDAIRFLHTFRNQVRPGCMLRLRFGLNFVWWIARQAAAAFSASPTPAPSRIGQLRLLHVCCD